MVATVVISEFTSEVELFTASSVFVTRFGVV